jgi:hypothetical protein
VYWSLNGTYLQDDSDDTAVRSTAALIRDRKSSLKATKTFKKGLQQNRAPIPRSKLRNRTLGELSNDLKAAGLDPSRIEDRAKIISDARKDRGKRKREEGEDDMEIDAVDEDGWVDDSSNDEAMEVDHGPRKRVKTGKLSSVVHRGTRLPARNRAVAGLSGVKVRSSTVGSSGVRSLICQTVNSKKPRLRRLNDLLNVTQIVWLALARRIDTFPRRCRSIFLPVCGP